MNPTERGVMNYANGNVYDGEWVDGNKHGKGKIIMTYANKEIYDGQWMNDKRHGKREQLHSQTVMCLVENGRHNNNKKEVPILPRTRTEGNKWFTTSSKTPQSESVTL